MAAVYSLALLKVGVIIIARFVIRVKLLYGCCSRVVQCNMKAEIVLKAVKAAHCCVTMWSLLHIESYSECAKLQVLLQTFLGGLSPATIK